MRLTLLPALVVLQMPTTVLSSNILSSLALIPNSQFISTTVSATVDTTNESVNHVSATAIIASVEGSTKDTAVDTTISIATFASYTYDSESTTYVVPITYTPDATCTGQSWSYTTTVPIRVSAIVSSSASAVSVYTSVILYSYMAPTTRVVAIVNPTDVSATDLESASRNYAPYGLNACFTPTTYCTTTPAATCTTRFVSDQSRSSGDISTSSNDYFSHEDQLLNTLILVAILVPVGWILLWLFVGLWTNWMSFEGLMLGLHCRRGFPYSWCLISPWLLCFAGPTYKAKSREEQVELLAKWKELKKSQSQ